MVIRKKETELALAMVNKNSRILLQNQLDLIDKEELKPHIYMVLTRPRSIIVRDSFNIDGEFFSGIIEVQYPERTERFNFREKHQFGTGNIRIETNYPFNSFKLIDNENDETVFDCMVSWFLHDISKIKDVLPLKVAYVGQSYGDYGERKVDKRLVSHKTLQEIYSDIINAEPDKEVQLYVSEFSCELVGTHIKDSIPSSVTCFQYDADDSIDHRLVINLVEASLIRYFQPEYNEKFKYNFPSKEHVSYREAYELDFNMIRVEVGSPFEPFCLLFSQSVKAQWHHICEYHFHNLDERKCMFDFSE